MSVAELSGVAWALAGGMAALALGMLAYALWSLAGLLQKLEGQLLPEAQAVVKEAHLILEEARSHVALVAEATGRAEALMAAAEPSVERLAVAAEVGSQAAGAVAGGVSRARHWVQVAGVAGAAAWRRYRQGKAQGGGPPAAGPGSVPLHAPAPPTSVAVPEARAAEAGVTPSA